MKVTLKEALERGRRALNGGQLENSLKIYAAILKSQPKDTKTKEEAFAVFKIAREKGLSGKAFEQLAQEIDKSNSIVKNHEFTPHALGSISIANSPPTERIQSVINLYNQGQLQKALTQANEILEKFPHSGALHNICGIAYGRLGKFDAAIESFNKLLEINPESSDAHLNLGNALKQSGKLEAAMDSYKQALKINPSFAHAYNNIGIILSEKQNKGGAIENFALAIKCDPNFTQAYENAINALRNQVYTKPKPDLLELISSLLSHPTYIGPKAFAPAAISLLKFEQPIMELLGNGSSKPLKISLSDKITKLGQVPILYQLMKVCPLPDIELENLLMGIRSEILFSLAKITHSQEIIKFLASLADQCFTNEYIYNQNKKETKELKKLDKIIGKALKNGQQPRPEEVLCLASYLPLSGFEWRELLASTAEIKEVYMRQILEPKQESALIQKIKRFGTSTDAVSIKVREQYEESPYPRWITLGVNSNPLDPRYIFKRLNLKFLEDVSINFEAPDILIAGCGTGQHSISAAARYKNSKVLAIDLSITSLAYAKRKSDEMNIESIEYMQADILALEELDKQFDIIECGGVLHHMDDPIAGWQKLMSCLKPGGLMKIGLYSELSRQNIKKIHEEINELVDSPGEDRMKQFRKHMIESDQPQHQEISRSNDFFTTSALRDLLFHVKEHRFTIPQLEKHLENLGLNFCGFENDQANKMFKAKYPELNAPYDLGKWQEFETDNPRIFAGMYQFWCQRV